MDWKTLATTFGAIFVAELGDKTQLATLSMSSTAQAKWAVFIGSALALVTTSAIAVLAGTAVTRVVPPRLAAPHRRRRVHRARRAVSRPPRRLTPPAPGDPRGDREFGLQ